MIKVSVFYANEEGKKFDMDYYLNSHIPMVQEKLGDAIKGGAVEQGFSGVEPGSPAIFVAMARTCGLVYGPSGKQAWASCC